MMFLTEKLRLVLKSAIAVVSIAAYAGATILYAGINEVGFVYVIFIVLSYISQSGGEFGVFGTPGTGLPGEFGVTYAFISEVSR